MSSVVWATNRDVISLDPITSASVIPEYTIDSLMCESLLRQAPDDSLEPGLATYAPRARRADVHAEAGGDVLGRPPGDLRGRGVQPRPPP